MTHKGPPKDSMAHKKDALDLFRSHMGGGGEESTQVRPGARVNPCGEGEGDGQDPREVDRKTPGPISGAGATGQRPALRPA